MATCFHCHHEIEKSADAACGWRHVKSQAVICRPTDATPMSAIQQQWWDYERQESLMWKKFKGKE